MYMRLLVLALAAAGGCSDGDDAPVDPHALGDCDTTWTKNGFTTCEAACKNSTVALTASGPACTAHDTAGAIQCGKTFVFAGVTGCCASVQPQVLFGECE